MARSLPLLILLAGCASVEPAPVPVRLSPRDVRERMQRGEALLLVCACETKKCRGSHPEGSISLETFETRPVEEVRSHDVVFFCGCPEQETATARARQLLTSGWSDVAILDGGLLGWIDEGLPLESPSGPPPEFRLPPIGWVTDLEDGRRLAAERGKPLVVCYVAAWCDACRRYRKRTLGSNDIAALSDRFVWAMLDVERDISLIRAHDLEGTPTTDLVDPWGVTRARITGFVGAATLRSHLESFEKEVRTGSVDPATYGRQELQSREGPSATDMPKGYRGTGICFSNVGYGPLRLPSLSPFQSLRYGMTPRTPSTLAEGAFEVQWTESWGNLWARDSGEHLVDFEILQSTVSVAYGLTDTVQFELGFVQKSRFGGFMDGFIQNFHDLFGLDQGGRDDVPKRDFSLQVDGPGGTDAVHLTNRDRGSFSESIVATLQHNVTCGTRVLPAFSYALSFRRELGEQEDMTEGEYADVSGSVCASKRIGDLYLYGSAAYSWFGREKFEEVDLRTTQLSGLLAIEWAMGDRASLVVQYLVTQGVAKDLREFSRPSYELTFGGKFEIAPGTVLEIGLIENAITFDNSPDFGVHAGLMYRF